MTNSSKKPKRKKRKKSIENILKFGGRKDEEMSSLYWLHGHPFYFNKNGKQIDLE